jgi:hypothetical protein
MTVPAHMAARVKQLMAIAMRIAIVVVAHHA